MALMDVLMDVVLDWQIGRRLAGGSRFAAVLSDWSWIANGWTDWWRIDIGLPDRSRIGLIDW